MERADASQVAAGASGVVAAGVVLVTNVQVGFPSDTESGSGLEEWFMALADSSTAARIGALARVMAAASLVVAAAVYCHQLEAATDDPEERSARWRTPVALAVLSGWAVTMAVGAATRGVLALFAHESGFAGVDESTLRLAVGLAEYVNALGLIFLLTGAILVAEVTHYSVVPTTTARSESNVGAAAVILAGVTGIAATVSVADPSTALHGAVTVAWGALLVTLTIDGIAKVRAKALA